MATTTKIDAHNARVCDAMILPFKRKLASLTIRSDIWNDAIEKRAQQGTAQEEARSRAMGAVGEIDLQVTQLADLKLPGEKKARVAEAEVQKLLSAFASMRALLIAMAGTGAVALGV